LTWGNDFRPLLQYFVFTFYVYWLLKLLFFFVDSKMKLYLFCWNRFDCIWHQPKELWWNSPYYF
jgi:hypothetical protein